MSITAFIFTFYFSFRKLLMNLREIHLSRRFRLFLMLRKFAGFSISKMEDERLNAVLFYASNGEKNAKPFIIEN